MDAHPSLRAQADLHLFETLMKNADVRRAAEAALEDSDQVKIRRQLLATSVRLTPALAPDLHAMIDKCKERLDLDSKFEPYVYPSAQCNAAVVKPEDGRVFLLFSSQILEVFDEQELLYVVGHELGHHKFDHHALPVRAVLEGTKIRPATALQLFSWSRFAEVSADRAGLYCAGSIEAVGRGLFKLASGLRGTKTNLAIDALLAQMEEIQADGIAKGDDRDRSEWFSTHPFSPLRLKAAQLFAKCEVMTEGGTTTEAMELDVSAVMGIMEPGYLKAKTDQGRALRRVLLAGGMMVAAASNGISEEEAEALDDLLGEGTVSDKLSVDALREDLPSRIRDAKAEAPVARRAQLLRDLCLIALADGHADKAERAVLRDIARRLEVDVTLVEQTLDADIELD
ncbi:MAG: M48 family metallopeptidase [Myxococcota bacterium]